MIPATLRRPTNSQRLVRLGPWKGVRDLGDAGAQSPEYLQDAINALFQSEGGASVVARPRFTRETSGALGTGNGDVRGMHIIKATNGDATIFAAVDTKIYRTTTLSTPATWTDVTPAGFGGTDLIRAVDGFASDFIFSDGTTRPWRGTDLSSTPITMTNIQYNTAADAWTARGSPTKYGGKLFFVVASVASTNYAARLAWSEEADVTLGYAQSGYTNFWDVFQSSTDPIFGVVGTEEGLYYFRSHSIGRIIGTVNSTFASASTKDNVADAYGMSPGTDLLLANDYIWFFHNALPHRLRVGTKRVEEIWRGMRRRITQIEQSDGGPSLTSRTRWAYSQDIGKVVALFYRENSAESFSRNLYVFNADTGEYEGRWQLELASQPSSEQSSAVQVLFLGHGPRTDVNSGTVLYVGGRTAGGTTKGMIWVQARRQQQSFGDNSAAMHFSVTPMLNPDEMVADFSVDELHAEAVPDSSTLSLDYYTPRGSTTGLTATGLTGSDSIQSSYDHGIYRFGLNARGRYFRPVQHWNVPSGTTPYAFERTVLKVRGIPTRGDIK